MFTISFALRLRPGPLWTRVRRPTMASLQTLLSLVNSFMITVVVLVISPIQIVSMLFSIGW